MEMCVIQTAVQICWTNSLISRTNVLSMVCCVLLQLLLHIPGIVDTGIFPGMAQRVYFGTEDGGVRVLDKS